MRRALPALALLVLSLPARPAAAAAVAGAYLEARTADLYGGPCTGRGDEDAREAILAWRVDAGEWNGVGLAGLAVVVVLRSERPDLAGGSRSVILVDALASAEQRAALEELARDSAGAVLGEGWGSRGAPIQLAVDPARALARLRVGALGELAELSTRPFNRLDPLCGDETLLSPPLVAGVDASPAVALRNAFRGRALGDPWQVSGRRGAFVGTFSR